MYCHNCFKYHEGKCKTHGEPVRRVKMKKDHVCHFPPAKFGDPPKVCTECGCTSPVIPSPGIREETNVGDLNSDAKGSAARKNGGKVMFHQIPMHLLAGTARVLMGGMQKYKPLNWAKGMDWSNCFDCTMRHMFKFWYAREELDQESMEHHLDHAICNLLFLKHYLTYYPEGDDRPPEGLFTTADIDQMFDAEEYCKRNEVGPYEQAHERGSGIPE